jgi:hypothetical protein
MYEKGTDILDCAACQKRPECPPSTHPYDPVCKDLLADFFHVGGQVVHETLPAGMVDLDKCSVCSWPVAEENPDMVDDVLNSGCIVLCDTDNGTEKKIYWGKTKVNTHGFCDIVVDVPAITRDVLLSLYVMSVIPE